MLLHVDIIKFPNLLYPSYYPYYLTIHAGRRRRRPRASAEQPADSDGNGSDDDNGGDNGDNGGDDNPDDGAPDTRRRGIII